MMWGCFNFTFALVVLDELYHFQRLLELLFWRAEVKLFNCFKYWTHFMLISSGLPVIFPSLFLQMTRCDLFPYFKYFIIACCIIRFEYRHYFIFFGSSYFLCIIIFFLYSSCSFLLADHHRFRDIFIRACPTESSDLQAYNQIFSAN